MVDLPSLPNTVPEVRPPTSRVSASDIRQPYEELANTLDKAGDVLMKDVAVPLAEKAGLKAVTRDADGNVQVEKFPIFGDAAVAFSHAVKTSALAEADGDARRNDITLREEFHNDPKNYLVAADKYRKEKIQQFTDSAGPEVGVAIGRVIDNQTTQTYHGLLNEQEKLTLQKASASYITGIQSASDDLTAMARGGVTTGPAWDAALDKVKTLTDLRVNNPRLAYPREQADYDLQHLQGELKANGFLYHVDQTYKDAPTKAEGAKAAMDYAGQILTDPALKLTQAQREHYYAKAVGEIRANETLRRQDVSDARLNSQDIMLRSSWGDKIEPQEVDAAYNRHINAGDQPGAARLLAHAARMPLGDAQGQRPLADQNRDLAALRGQSAAKQAYDFFTKERGYTPAQASGIVGNLIHESSLDPTAIHDHGTGLGIAGWRQERLQRLAAFAKESGRDPRDFRAQLEFVDKELQSTEFRAFTALKAATTPGDAAAAFLHFERPQGYDPGNLAASSGYGSRVAQAKAVYGGQGVIDTGSPASALWLQVNRARTVDAAAWTQWKQIKEDYKSEGIRPPDKTINTLLDSARLSGDHALLEEISKTGDQIAFAQDMSQRGLPDQAAKIAELHQLASDQGLQPGMQAVLKDLERRKEAISKGLEENPIATAAANIPGVKAPPPLNLQDPQQLMAGLGTRGRIAQVAAQNWKVPPRSALDKADIAAVQGALATPDPAIKAGIFQAITTALPEDVRNATLKKLGEAGPEQMVSAAAGGLMGAAPDIAQSVLRGQQAIKADKGYLPHAGSEKTTFDEDFAKALPSSAFTLAARTDPAGPMAIAKGAIEARYADLSAQANDTAGKHNPDRLKQAVADVTGGVLDHNGGKLIAPARGMSQGNFDGLIWGLGDKDLAGVSTLAGEPVTADYLRSNAQLESVGSGRYLVRLGRDAAKPIYAYQGANSEMPQKFILDLRGRPQGQIPYHQEILVAP